MPSYDAGVSGLVGTVGVTVLSSAGAVLVARTTSGISEPVAGSGVYFVADYDPQASLVYVWDNGAGTVGASELLYAGRGDRPEVVVVSPVATTGVVTVYAGDDYSAADGRAFVFRVPVAGTPSLSGATVRLCSGPIRWASTNVSGDGTYWTITIEATKAQTVVLAPCRSDYELEATLAGGRVVTLAAGQIHIVANLGG